MSTDLSYPQMSHLQSLSEYAYVRRPFVYVFQTFNPTIIKTCCGGQQTRLWLEGRGFESHLKTQSEKVALVSTKLC